jgi:hypothetical protein
MTLISHSFALLVVEHSEHVRFRMTADLADFLA